MWFHAQVLVKMRVVGVWLTVCKLMLTVHKYR